MARRSYAEDRTWADAYLPAFQDVARRLGFEMTGYRQASADDDRRWGTDLVLEVGDLGALGTRVRRPDSPYEWSRRYYTVRLGRPSGRRTEWAKLQAGDAPRLALTAYAMPDLRTDVFMDWWLVDAHAAVDYLDGLLHNRDEYPERVGVGVRKNPDGTSYARAPHTTLAAAGCVVAERGCWTCGAAHSGSFMDLSPSYPCAFVGHQVPAQAMALRREALT